MENRESRFGLSISIINRASQSYFYHKLKHLDVGPGEQAYLLSIHEGESILQEDLARRLKVDKANVTRAIKKLEASGYVSRTVAAADKRARHVSLTAKGLRVRSEIAVIAGDWVAYLQKSLTDEERRHIEELLEKVAQGLDPREHLLH